MRMSVTISQYILIVCAVRNHEIARFSYPSVLPRGRNICPIIVEFGPELTRGMLHCIQRIDQLIRIPEHAPGHTSNVAPVDTGPMHYCGLFASTTHPLVGLSLQGLPTGNENARSFNSSQVDSDSFCQTQIEPRNCSSRADLNLYNQNFVMNVAIQAL